MMDMESERSIFHPRGPCNPWSFLPNPILFLEHRKSRRKNLTFGHCLLAKNEVELMWLASRERGPIHRVEPLAH